MNNVNEFLSVVILNYKNYDMTINCIDKLLENNYKFQIVIVDNNSNNNSFEILSERYKNISNIVVLFSNSNSGYGAGNNIGIKYIRENTKCRYVCIMNPDILIEEKNIFENLIFKLEKYNLQGITGLQLTNNIFDSSTLGWKLPTFKDILILNSKVLSRLINTLNYKVYNIENNKDSLAIIDVMPGCFFIINIDIFEKIGYFDENTFLYYEENILSYKAKELNFRFGLSLSDVYIHDHKEKDESLLKLENKYRDRKILLKSQSVYVKDYLKVNKLKLAIYNLSKVFNIYIELPIIHIIKMLKRNILRRL